LLERNKNVTQSVREQPSSLNQRQQLVTTIEQTLGHALSPRLKQAFLAVAREQFVPTYYIQEHPGRWKAHQANDVYQDRALITKINAQGHPCSSSSTPSIMAAMLEALAVPVGGRVLEIGTGTGYNAALLAELVGPDGQVVSIDIDDELVMLAAARLHEAGYAWVQGIAADGRQGYACAQPYDCIIITAGLSSIAPAWIAQLAKGGILVGNLLRALATPLFRVVKHADATLQGHLLPTSAFFMSLTSEAGAVPPPRINYARFEALPCIERTQTTLEMVNLLYDQSLSLSLETRFPGIQRAQRYLGGSPKNIGTCLSWKETLLTLAPLDREEGLSAAQWTVETRGQVPLWSLVQACYEQWRGQGQPPVDRYRLEVSPQGAYRIYLPEKEEVEERQS
jgi:protein-L-isoaspartate(D-aspartate) O-methyltransferase